MQTPEAGADSASTVPLQTAVPVQPAGSAQQVTSQVPVQQQVNGCVCVCVCVFHLHVFDLCVTQTVQQVQHVYPAQVQYVEENSGVYTNGTM
ncbi:unnamed protein product [Oncorhynchus mykiss]|uniref:RFX1 transcription activation region domain-containing protein n=1 Tax=Oncorhynchus mykiss TaxID=8022 RepID=A0A060VZ77_ONCMY|nr:unnamed protein product [Oncorhynchus mykiss]